MKFSELDDKGWAELQPYFDTCLLPVTGLSGREAPWEMADRAADAGDWLFPLEKAFRGRTVTLPAYHYYDGSEESADKLKLLCSRFREAGFRYVVLICGKPDYIRPDIGADLILQPDREAGKPDPEALFTAIKELWNNAAASFPSGQSKAGGREGAPDE